MKGITDEKGIPVPKLEHIFLGTVKTNEVSGYHCDKDYGDELVYAEKYLYPKSKRLITLNGNQRLFEAQVRDKKKHMLKENKSSFYCIDWTRQDVVDCIARAKKSNKIVKRYGKIRNVRNMQNVYYDKDSGLVLVENRAGWYPLIKY